jgi:hypothetical protein
VTGSISAASRPFDDAALTTLAEISAKKRPVDGEAPLVNGSLIRVGIKGSFPFEETSSLERISMPPKRPFVPPQLPE